MTHIHSGKARGGRLCTFSHYMSLRQSGIDILTEPKNDALIPAKQLTNYRTGKPHMLTTTPDTGADNWWLVGDSWWVAICWWQFVGGNWLVAIGWWKLVGDNWWVAIGTHITAAQRRRPSSPAPAYIRPPAKHQSTAPATQITAAQTRL